MGVDILEQIGHPYETCVKGHVERDDRLDVIAAAAEIASCAERRRDAETAPSDHVVVS
jgi:hypothetical protein